MGPSRRCDECAKRHVKCDRKRPTCSQCESTFQPCTWTSNEKSETTAFLIENAYANGSVYRPRGPRKPTSSRHCDTSRNKNPQPPTARFPTRAVQVAELFNLCAQPRISLLDIAVTKYNHTFLRNAKTSRSELEGFLANHGTTIVTSDFQRTVSTALSAVTLIYFGRSHNSQTAIRSSQTCYQNALLGTRAKIESLNGAVPDSVLLTILLLASYEDKMGNHSQADPLPNSYKHLQSAAAFLPDRQYQPLRTESSLLLDEIVWRRAVNIAINRGTRLSDSVKDCARSGETLSQQLLLECMVEVAGVNVDMRDALKERTGSTQVAALSSVLGALQALYARLRSVQTTLTASNGYTICNVRPDHQVCVLRPILQQYYALASCDNINAAYDLALCAASLLRVADMMVRIICKDTPLNQHQHEPGLLGTSLQSVRRHVAEVFATVPYHFGAVYKPAKTVMELCENADALLVGRLTFPLHAVGQAFSTTREEKIVAKELLLLGSQVTANMVLPALYSDRGPFRIINDTPTPRTPSEMIG